MPRVRHGDSPFGTLLIRLAVENALGTASLDQLIVVYDCVGLAVRVYWLLILAGIVLALMLLSAQMCQPGYGSLTIAGWRVC